MQEGPAGYIIDISAGRKNNRICHRYAEIDSACYRPCVCIPCAHQTPGRVPLLSAQRIYERKEREREVSHLSLHYAPGFDHRNAYDNRRVYSFMPVLTIFTHVNEILFLERRKEKNFFPLDEGTRQKYERFFYNHNDATMLF